MKRVLLFIFFLAAFSGAAVAQSVRVTALADKKAILIGEPFQLQLEATGPAGQPVRWSVPDSIPHFEIMQRSPLDSQVSGGKLVLKQTLTLTSWDSGAWVIPSFSLPRSNRTLAIPVAVNYTPEQTPDYHDVKDVLDVPRPQRDTWYWYVIGLIFLLLLFYLFFPDKKKKEPEEKPVIRVDAYREAVNRLEKLRREGAPEEKAFYTELISIFRQYLHGRKGISSHSKTTEDLSAQLGSLQLPQSLSRELLQVLQLSDAVKFARFRPGAEENEHSLKTIHETIVTIERGT